jgi:predicted MPP superfamily phosphohydrolase
MNPLSFLRLAASAILAYSFVEPWRLQVREFEIRLENLPPECENLRIAQLTDLHAGMQTPLPLLRRMIQLCAAQQPDLVLITGDVVSRRNSYLPPLRPYAHPITDYAEGLARELQLLTPRLGMYAVAGNHDHYEGEFSSIHDILATAGVGNLNNRSVRLENGLTLVGIDDLRAGKPDLNRALEGVTKEDAVITLCHNPRYAWLLRQHNTLILSGHTHGGQVALPFGLTRTPVDAKGTFFRRGFYRLGKARLYVSAGAGTIGIPVRLGVLPEIPIFTLRGA